MTDDEFEKGRGISRRKLLGGSAAAAATALLATSGCQLKPSEATPTPDVTKLLEQIASLQQQIAKLKEQNNDLQTKLTQAQGELKGEKPTPAEPRPEIKEPESDLGLSRWFTPQSEPRPDVEHLPLLDQYPFEGLFGPSRFLSQDGTLLGVIEGRVIIREEQFPLPKNPGLDSVLNSLTRPRINNRPFPLLVAEQMTDAPVKFFSRSAVFKTECPQPNQASPRIDFQNNDHLDLGRPPVGIDDLPALDHLKILSLVEFRKEPNLKEGTIDTMRVLLFPRRHEGKEIITPQSYLLVCKETDPGSWHHITGIEAIHLREIRIPNSEDAEISQAIGTEGVAFGIPGYTRTSLTQAEVRPKEKWAIMVLDPDRKPVGVKKITLDPNDFLPEPQLI